jgi:hypothetical protein
MMSLRVVMLTALLFVYCGLQKGQCAKILALMNLASPSHYIFNRVLLIALANKGHQVFNFIAFESKHRHIVHSEPTAVATEYRQRLSSLYVYFCKLRYSSLMPCLQMAFLYTVLGSNSSIRRL